MGTKSLIPNQFIPTASRSGNGTPTLFRGANFFIRGRGVNTIAECYGGSLNLSEPLEPVAITGTVSFSPSSTTITGVSTLFLTELALGQMLETLAGEILSVAEIVSDTVFIAHSKPLTTGSGVTAYQLHVLNESNRNRFTQLAGNSYETDRGNILAIGRGVVRKNGSALTSSLTATRRLKIALYDPTTGNYTIQELGFAAAPTGITIAASATSSPKGMPGGDRSLRIAKASTKLGVPSYGNPGQKLTVTVIANKGIDISFPAMDSNGDATNPHDAWRIYGSRFGGTTDTATAAAKSGPWYYIKTVTSTDLAGTGAASYFLEYLDAEIDGFPRLISFDNDAPPDAEFIASVVGSPILVSCQGKPTVAKPLGTSPGPSIVPIKTKNLAAAPLVFDTGVRNEVPTSPPETIIGFYLANGKLYLLTANSLPIAIFTGSSDYPIATRPFWKSGFKNPYAICFAQDRLYGFTTGGAMRSLAEGGEGSENDDFSLDVKELTSTWDAARVMVKEDPQNKCVCFIYGGAYKNTAGFWVSIILPFMLGFEAWGPPIVISSDTHDMIISGAATVGGHLEFVAGGRDGVGAMQEETYRFDGGGGEAVPYYLAWGFMDDGLENISKKVMYPRVTGKFTSGTLGIHGAGADETVDVTALELGNSGSKSGSISLGSPSTVKVGERQQVEVNGLLVYTIRVDGTWSGSGDRDRIDELIYESNPVGSRR